MLLSYADRSRAIPPDLIRGIDTRTQESLSTFTLDGFVAGIWRIDRVRDAATLVVTPIRPLSKRETSALGDEGQGLVAFLAADSTVRDFRVAEVARLGGFAGGLPSPVASKLTSRSNGGTSTG